MMALINGLLYIVSGLGLLAEYMGWINMGLTTILSPAALSVFSGIGAVIYAKTKTKQ